MHLAQIPSLWCPSPRKRSSRCGCDPPGWWRVHCYNGVPVQRWCRTGEVDYKLNGLIVRLSKKKKKLLNLCISNSRSRLQALLCSCFVPGYCGILPPSLNGVVSIWLHWGKTKKSCCPIMFLCSYFPALYGWRFQPDAASFGATLPYFNSVSLFRRDGHLSPRQALHVGHGGDGSNLKRQLGQWAKVLECALPPKARCECFHVGDPFPCPERNGGYHCK